MDLNILPILTTPNYIHSLITITETFQVFENVRVGYIVGSVATTDSSSQENIIPGSSGSHVTYTLTSLMPDNIKDAFEIDRNTGSLVVSRELDREVQSEYRLEVRALDTSAMNNPKAVRLQ